MATAEERRAHNKLMDIERVLQELDVQLQSHKRLNHQACVREDKAKIDTLQLWVDWLVDCYGMPSAKEQVEWKESRKVFYNQEVMF